MGPAYYYWKTDKPVADIAAKTAANCCVKKWYIIQWVTEDECPSKYTEMDSGECDEAMKLEKFIRNGASSSLCTGYATGYAKGWKFVRLCKKVRSSEVKR